MNNVCPTCGLVKELCVCETIAKENQVIKVYTVTKKFRKKNTVIEGIDPKEIDIKDIGRRLKGEFACGGTIKDGNIELQGDHTSKMKDALVRYGFVPSTIQVQVRHG